MKFINNWQATLTNALPAGGSTLPADTGRLQGGVYRLTITEPEPTPGSSWEIMDVASGGAITARGLEGTTARQWPAGSVVYAGLTAGMLEAIIGRIEALEACCDNGGNENGITAELTDFNGNLLTDELENTLTGD